MVDQTRMLTGVMDATDDVIVTGPSIYVYEAPVRLWHWGNALCITILAVTGYLIGSPPPTMPGEASGSFLFGYIRFAHFAAGQVLAVAFLARILWAFWGNKYSRQIFYLPVWEKTWWKGVIREARWYLFLEKEPYKYIGHNPLAHTAMFAMFTLFNLGMIITGFALYSEGTGRDSWQAKAFGWVFDIWPNSQDVHTLHHLGMWVIVIFAIVHIYAAVREDIMSRQTMISTMISGERQFRDEREG
ncbi:Ni/Fe-hydrogenase, b-type cytochrome subunit [Pleomorphomonas diazotrophica]|uniref:Probable Ni/Fe-hydrogenase B-type cytochrome subunit n=2 Tax=Pleomorphomonas diazotrophica TaxID=1166257 RepID=A0A1I4QA89_9HYPH|nr:Ni/Fe-hydrogenase, b-type cytochrome subunit [Pleomorphomonas diazotrophica]SFM37011.1 Ni/Fe-hydrogenase 1 B-type cytochrome subunit [Pleomorphomonas diazotrophica]